MTYSRRIDKNKLFRALIIMTLTVFMIVQAATMAFSYIPENEREYKTVVVCSGDTLWSIASKYASGDIRRKIKDIKSFNNLESDFLTVGEHILVPIND
ncbi:MAG: LysM peptidoglycan-binding domain-containing protein [Monoglobales bacterium]